jgi:hypothetical protein
LAITTRPEQDGLADCQYLQSCGLAALSQPVLDIVPLPHPPLADKAATADALILTSRHAASLIKAEAEGAGLLTKPCFVVGDATAKAAGLAGFKVMAMHCLIWCWHRNITIFAGLVRFIRVLTSKLRWKNAPVKPLSASLFTKPNMLMRWIWPPSPPSHQGGH